MSELALGSPSSANWLAEGRFFLVDRFQVGPELGRGGMGSVHEAWDPLLRRPVALKLLHRTEAKAVLGLFQEAQAQARLDHPGICPIFEMGTAQGMPFIAMEQVHGQPLGHMAAALDLRGKVALMADVAQAVRAAHEAGLVHRDLKPANILVALGEDGTPHPKVVDFGLALDLRSTDRSLSWGMAGTPAFMSPEQTRGEPLTFASDVYSLGATMFALLTGRPPFEAVTISDLFRQQEEAPAPRLWRLDPGLPRDLGLLVGKCLEAEPRLRYAHAGELEEDLRRFLAGLPLKGKAAPLAGRIWRWIRRRGREAATIAGTILCLSLLAGWSLPRANLARRRLALAERFGWEVKGLEDALTLERLLPSHDLQPAERAMAAGLDRIRRDLAGLEEAAQGPGHFALSRGYLALRDWEEARRECQRARAAGFAPPELDHAEGLALAGQVVDGILPLPGEAPAPAPPRNAALALLRTGPSDPASLDAARAALLAGKPERCLALCARALREDPAQADARLLSAQAWAAKAMTHGADAAQALDQAEAELVAAQSIVRSDAEVFLWSLRVLDRQLSLQESRPDRAMLPMTAPVARQALSLRPGDPALWRACAALLLREGRLRLAVGEDARIWLWEQLDLCRSAPASAGLEDTTKALQDLLREQGRTRRDGSRGHHAKPSSVVGGHPESRGPVDHARRF